MAFPSASAAAAGSLSALRHELKSEMQLMELVIFKNNNQHRRTLYFRSFKSCCKIVRRFLLATKAMYVHGSVRP
jgi:hypothetical protein